MGAEEIQRDRRKFHPQKRRRSVTKEVVVLRDGQHLESVFRPQAAMSASPAFQGLKACMKTMLAGGVAMAPVTNIRALREFASLVDSPIVRDSSALSLVPKLRGRPTFMTISSNDERVSTEDCIAFQNALRGEDFGEDTHRLMIEPGEGHTASDDAYAAGAAWMLDLIARYR